MVLDLSALPVSRRAYVSALILLILMPAVMLGQYAPPPYRLPYKARCALLFAQNTLTYGPILVLHLPWLSLLGFLAGAVLLTVPRPASLIIAAAVCASGPLLVRGLKYEHRSGLAVLLTTLITGASIFGISQLALLAARLRATQAHTAQSAAQDERARLARDLHDIVGSRLAQLAHRAEAATSAAALPGIARLARGALVELRQVSRGETTLDLRTEMARTGRTLAEVGITVRSEVAPLSLPPEVDHCLAVVLREAVANVLHHSNARTCLVELTWREGAACLRVTNDYAEKPEGTIPGTGLTNLKERATALGGTVTTEHRPRNHFRLEAHLPLV
ncbi:histidine kinase [Streptomyces sp. NBC_00237]|uniref:sensor histidine kinase n=1 Tax=Streptomyces sp. NBC_00237 TaxID=2975687 RepID=UPI00224F5475|nr:histidine kinase [Streptomyces sp. NBC_00237]MCX5201567.1 histidine kinase [Streptomyces sp. NBC_00237]